MSPATKMLSVTTPLMSKARQPASQATPQNPAASSAPSSHSMLRTEPSDATTTSTSSVVPSESLARLTCPSASPSRASTATPVRRSTPASRCILAAMSPITPPSAPTSGALDRSATVTSSPRSRQTDAGGDQQSVGGHLVAVGQRHLAVVTIQAGRRNAEAPVGVDRPHPWQLGVPRRHPPLEHLLGQRRAVVRLVNFVADERQRSGE